MSVGPLLSILNDRVQRDKEEGDIAYFHALGLQLEYLTKVITAAVVAVIGDDADRHRYSLEHSLIRANAVGGWADTLNSALTGPAAQFILPSAREFTKQLSERCGAPDWRYEALRKIGAAARVFNVDSDLGKKGALRQLFEIGAKLRNRTRGHGAVTGNECGEAAPQLALALAALESELELFHLPWAYLRQNLNGKYRVTSLLGTSEPFDYLRRTREEKLAEGVYVYCGQCVHVPLVRTDPDVRDVLLPNGNYRRDEFEVLSYATNQIARQDASDWNDPPARLPPSETEGGLELDQFEQVLANLPPRARDYVDRCSLERAVCDELVDTERHPMVTLTGPGGIGKTSIALTAIYEISRLEECPYEVMLWISARDIDLLDSGPKRVTPRVVTRNDICRSVLELVGGSVGGRPAYDLAEKVMADSLRLGVAGLRTLFIFDNFETVEDPGDVFRWIDIHVRPPQKVLITTRTRDFVGDYPIPIGGMTDDEAGRLIESTARRLGVRDLLDSGYLDSLIRESEGHPYVIKMLLGRVASERRAVNPERIVATADQLLKALFERTYADLSSAGKRVFLLLCSWRVYVPEIALHAVLLRPGNERFDVGRAIDELGRFSLIEQVQSEEDGSVFVGVPLAASIYGRGKLRASAMSVAIEQDRKLLMEFGAGKKDSVRHGTMPRIERHVKAVAERVSDLGELEQHLPVLEFLASQYRPAYLRLAELVTEVDASAAGAEAAKGYVRSYLEDSPVAARRAAWFYLAELCGKTGDVVGEVHALSEAALLPNASPEDMEHVANHLNNRLRDLKGRKIDDAWSSEVGEVIEKVAGAMESRVAALSATGCSRLAWLYLNMGSSAWVARARDVARLGLEKDPHNSHCIRLLERLEG